MIKQTNLLLMATMLASFYSLTACGKRAPDGLSMAGAVQSVGAVGSTVKPADLSDVTAIVQRLRDVEKAAPPVDFTNEKSRDDRRVFYVAAKNKALGVKPSFLLPITCTAGTDFMTPFVYDPSSKNVAVRIYTGSKAASYNATAISKLISDEIKLYRTDSLYMITTGHDLLDDRQPENLIPTDAAENFHNTASLRLLNGPIIDVSNSEIGGAIEQLRLALSTAQLEHTKAALAVTRGQVADHKSQFKPLMEEMRRWNFFPDGQLPEPFWSHRIPYAGDASRLCLIGRFYDPDLVGGELFTPFANPASAFEAQITDWYVINRDTGKVIATAKNPSGVEK